MDKDSKFVARFCWPEQDRVRANRPLTAPRKSSVFTASVCFCLVTPVHGPRRSCLAGALPLPSREAASGGPRSGPGTLEVVCGCCEAESPGRSSLFRGVRLESHRDMRPFEIAFG